MMTRDSYCRSLGKRIMMTAWILALSSLLVLTADAAEWGGFEPEFTESISNVTVPTGRDAVFTCSVANLGGHKVGWVKADTKAIQAIHLTVVTHNPRVSVEHVGSNTFKLIIRSVRVEDAGFYMAQINTDPMKSQMAYLDVTEPPDIIDAQTPAELRVRENEALKLTCQARGHPSPRIAWKREDGQDLGLNHREVAGRNKSGTTASGSGGVGGAITSYEGEVLRITQVTKRHMGIYYCIASNGVPPSVSKRVAVTVLFPPTVTLDNQIVGVPLGTNVTLGCIVESSPKSINVWYKDDKMIANHSRLSFEERVMESSYRIRMVLTISHFRKADVGRYECRCRNEHGEADGTIKVHDLPPLRTTTTTTTPQPIYMIGDNDIYPLLDDPTTTTSRPPYLYRDWTLVLSGRPHPTPPPAEYPTPHSMAAQPTDDGHSTPRPHHRHRPSSSSIADSHGCPSIPALFLLVVLSILV